MHAEEPETRFTAWQQSRQYIDAVDDPAADAYEDMRTGTTGTYRFASDLSARHVHDSDSANSASNQAYIYEEDTEVSDAPEGQPYSRAGQRPRKRRPLRVALAALAVVVLVGVGAAFGYFGNISSALHSGVDNNLRNALVQTDMSTEPFYMVLMGTDRSRYRADYEDYGDQFRSDSMMLARIDAPNRKVTLVSIHRDILYDFGNGNVDKLNTAYALGGPAKVVQVISGLAGVDISHYAEIDFDAFSELVNDLGGVEVNVPIDIDDPDVGGSLDAGYQLLDGDQALMLCRARNNYADYGTDPDLMRAANQRAVLSAIAAKIMDADVGTIANSVQTLSGYITTDLELNDIIGLAQAFHDIDPATDIYSGMTPTEGVFTNGGWYENLDKAAWKTMMERVDAGLPPTESTIVDEYTGTVMATAGTAASAGSELAADSEASAAGKSSASASSSGSATSGSSASGSSSSSSTANSSSSSAHSSSSGSSNVQSPGAGAVEIKSSGASSSAGGYDNSYDDSYDQSYDYDYDYDYDEPYDDSYDDSYDGDSGDYDSYDDSDYHE